MVKKVKEEGEDGKEQEVEITIPRPGNKDYLIQIIEILQAERELWGLDVAKEVKIKGTMTNTNLNWDVLAAAIPDSGVPDVIEQEVRKGIPGLEYGLKEIVVPSTPEQAKTE